MEAKKTRAVAYCRVSLAQQNSEIQITNIKDFCGHRGFDLKNIYLDHGIGGSKESRPQLNQLVKDARLGKNEFTYTQKHTKSILLLACI